MWMARNGRSGPAPDIGADEIERQPEYQLQFWCTGQLLHPIGQQLSTQWCGEYNRQWYGYWALFPLMPAVVVRLF